MTKHPETGTRFEWGQACGNFVVRTISKIEGRDIYTNESGNWGTVDEFYYYIASGDIRNILSPSASPASGPDRTKHKAWCGLELPNELIPWANGKMELLSHNGGPPIGGKRYDRAMHAYCTEACRDARLPPVQSKPAETGKPYRCTECVSMTPDVHGVHCTARKTKPAQEAPKALPFSFTDQEGREHRFATSIARDNASRDYLAWMKAQSGTPYAGPERLERPKLAHSMGIEDPALEDA